MLANPVNFEAYKDSVNMAFGFAIDDPQFDIFNNSYVELIAYEYK